MTGCALYEKPVPVPEDRLAFSYVLSQKIWYDKSTIHGDECVQSMEMHVYNTLKMVLRKL